MQTEAEGVKMLIRLADKPAEREKLFKDTSEETRNQTTRWSQSMWAWFVLRRSEVYVHLVISFE